VNVKAVVKETAPELVLLNAQALVGRLVQAAVEKSAVVLVTDSAKTSAMVCVKMTAH
jgi:hypothetical protein